MIRKLVLGAAALAMVVSMTVATDAHARKAKQKAAPTWIDANGEVTNASEAEEGYGETVEGVGGWSGEIVGKPVPGGKFDQLKIGMPLRQVTDIVGQPTDQGAYVTGKAFIPFFGGAGMTRTELVYKGKGRLIFDSKGGFDSGANLVWIINSASEPGYRD